MSRILLLAAALSLLGACNVAAVKDAERGTTSGPGSTGRSTAASTGSHGSSGSVSSGTHGSSTSGSSGSHGSASASGGSHGAGSSGSGASASSTTGTSGASGASGTSGASGAAATSGSSSGGGTSGSTPTCACYAGNNDYCGQTATQWAAAHGCAIPAFANDPNALVTCSNGSWSLKQSCPNGCTVSAGTAPDVCTLPTCACYAGDNDYCGQPATQWAAAHGCAIPAFANDPNALVTCSNGSWSLKQSCPSGCTVSAGTAPDVCTPQVTPYRLWIAWDANTVGCAQHVTDFYNCILGRSDFNSMTTAYPNGQYMVLANTAVLNSYCAPSDFQCVIDQTGFTPSQYDIVMHYHGTSWTGGFNNSATVVVNGQSVFINTAWVEAGANCDAQTCTGAHELYEAATDRTSADCCNGQVGTVSCPSCNASCGQFFGNGGNPPWGCYDLACGGATYKMELLSPPGNKYDASGCTALTVH